VRKHWQRLKRRSASVSETAPLGSLTERQRVILAAVCSSPKKKERKHSARADGSKQGLRASLV
jgi:hypothetical protein